MTKHTIADKTRCMFWNVSFSSTFRALEFVRKMNREGASLSLTD